MHGPEQLRVLLTGAVCSFVSRRRIRVNVQREVAEDVDDLTSDTVRFIQKRLRLQSMTGAERSLEVRKIYQTDRRIRVAAVEVAFRVHTDLQARQLRL